MKDFLKIFFVLCGLVAAFVFGRNYGEKTITESKEYIKMRSDSAETEKSASELAALKTKFQDLLDSSDLKKADEVLSKIMTVFLADLSLHLSEEKEKDLSIGKAQCVTKPVVAEKPIEKTQAPIEKNQRVEKSKSEKWTNLNQARYKSYEWMLKNAQSNKEVLRFLEKTEIKNINAFISEAKESDSKIVADLNGVFKGPVKDVNQNTYASITMSFKKIQKQNKDFLTGSIEVRKVGQDGYGVRTFSSSGGLGQQIDGMYGVIIGWEKTQYIQMYKLNNEEKIAGNFYEHLPNGTTKTIGTFILNRVDQF